MTTPIFNAEKALEATLFVAERLKTPDFHKVFKILYFADRDHLAAYGRAITGDTYIKMQNGPVPSRIYDGLKSLRENAGGLFSGAAEVDGRMYLKPLRSPNLHLISQSDVDELGKSVSACGKLSFEELTRRSHAYAWSASADNGKIALENIMREAGADDGFIEYITENINAEKTLSNLWRR